MSVTLDQSFDYCRQLTQRRARNFYYAFKLLGPDEHDALCAIYAFMRYCDDLSDDPWQDRHAARRQLEAWRADLDSALDGAETDHPLWPAFRQVMQDYKLPRSYFHEMIQGVASDLETRTFVTFGELYRYCYQVASIPGLCVARVLGAATEQALALAEKCGVAFQLTNILRDVPEDAARGRVYFPEEDLARFGLSRRDILDCRNSEAVRQLFRFEGERAFVYYRESAPLVEMVPRKNRTALWALIEIYRQLLLRIERSGYDVLDKRARLTSLEKLAVVATALKRSAASR
ncbi:MAG: phytoene/squalene synthase family protein [Bryobacteraceae bacterium]